MIWAVRWNCSTSFRLCILPQPVQQVYAPMVETEVPKEAEAEHIPKQCMFLFESVFYDQILYPRKALIIFDWLSCLKIIELISCVWCTDCTSLTQLHGQGHLSTVSWIIKDLESVVRHSKRLLCLAHRSRHSRGCLSQLPFVAPFL